VSDVRVSGPLFEGRLDVKGGLKEGMDRIAAEGASLVRKHLSQRARYRTAKWGHVADAVRTQVKPLSGGDVGARIYLGGRSAFVGAFLEGGTKAHPIPKVRVRGSGNRRSLVRKETVLAFMVGGGLIFRATANHRGTPAYHWREKAQGELEPQVQGILDRALGERVST